MNRHPVGPPLLAPNRGTFHNYFAAVDARQRETFAAAIARMRDQPLMLPPGLAWEFIAPTRRRLSPRTSLGCLGMPPPPREDGTWQIWRDGRWLTWNGDWAEVNAAIVAAWRSHAEPYPSPAHRVTDPGAR